MIRLSTISLSVFPTLPMLLPSGLFLAAYAWSVLAGFVRRDGDADLKNFLAPYLLGFLFGSVAIPIK